MRALGGHDRAVGAPQTRPQDPPAAAQRPTPNTDARRGTRPTGTPAPLTRASDLTDPRS